MKKTSIFVSVLFFTLLAVNIAAAQSEVGIKEEGVGVSAPAVEQAFEEILDREPTAQEIIKYRGKGIQSLKKELNKSEERTEAINEMYQKALKRNARQDEIDALKKFGAPANRIRKQLFESDERELAIKDAYKELLGREPQANDLDFYVKTRSPFDKIKEVLGKSPERETKLQQFFKEEVGREATTEEIKEHRQEFLGKLREILPVKKKVIVKKPSIGRIKRCVLIEDKDDGTVNKRVGKCNLVEEVRFVSKVVPANDEHARKFVINKKNVMIIKFKELKEWVPAETDIPDEEVSIPEVDEEETATGTENSAPGVEVPSATSTGSAEVVGEIGQ